MAAGGSASMAATRARSRRPQPGAMGRIVDRLGARLTAPSARTVAVVIPVAIAREILVGRAGVRRAPREQRARSHNCNQPHPLSMAGCLGLHLLLPRCRPEPGYKPPHLPGLVGQLHKTSQHFLARLQRLYG
jgi:hypothetical protein